jgi:transcriptional regulator with XRE-family HTH domain
MTSIDQALSAFIDAWNAGERPDVIAYLDRVDAGDRPALADEIEMWLDVAPTPRYDEATRAQISSDPILLAALAAGTAAAMPFAERVRAARERAGLAIAEAAERVARAAGLTGQEQRTAEYLGRLERDELDERRVSRRLVDALARAFGADPDALSPSWGAAAPAAVQFRLSEPHADSDFDPEALGQQFDALARAAATPAPEPLDDVDRLFLGGPDG